MSDRSSRRSFLSSTVLLAGAAMSAHVPTTVRGQRLQVEPRRISERTVAFVGPDATVLATAGRDGIVLFDGGHERWSAALLEAIVAQFDGAAFRALFNSHWHREQTGANLLLGQAGVPIYAHENTRLWLGTEVWVRWSDKHYRPLPEAARPRTGFDGSGTIEIAERPIEYTYLRHAHTDGDICIYLPDENVLYTGGAVSNAGWPVIDWWTGGWIGGMLDGFDRLLEIADSDTVVVPSDGPLMSLGDLREQHEMYLTVFDRLHEMLRKAWSTQEVIAARPTKEFGAEWGDPEQFLTLAFQSMWRHLRDAHDTRMQNIP